MSTQTAIVVVACHFENKNQLCAATIRRLDRAQVFARRVVNYTKFKDAPFILTGPVPYESGSKTLSDLMREYLISEGVLESRIFGGEGVGIFSEARNVVADIKKRFPDCKKFVVVSSDWYFIPGWKIWNHFASESGLEIETVEVENTGGAKTRAFYLFYGILVWLSFIFRLSGLMEKFMTKLHAGRKESFKFDGCA